MGVRSGTEQRVEHARAAVGGRQRERGHAVLVGGIDVGARRDQRLGQGHVIPVRRPLQGRGAVRLWPVHVGSLFEQGFDGCHVPVLGRGCQPHVLGIRRNGAANQNHDP